MSGGSRTFQTRYDHDRLARRVVFKASTDTEQLTSTALLSYPECDLAGDVVRPEGIDFFRHMRDPAVDVEHRRDPAFGSAAVGKAMDATGNYTGRHVLLKCHDGQDRPLPVGTTHFDPSNALQSQAFALVERGILPDVSLEFVPDMACAKSLGKSPLEPRDAYEFGRVSVVRWTLCAKGVCPSATVLKSTHDPLRSVLSAKRIGGEQLHPVLFKALAPIYLPGGKRTTVTNPGLVGKADMDPYGNSDMPADAPPAAPVEDVPPPEEEEAPALGGIAAMYAKVQALLDSVDQNEADMETSDSPELRTFMEKMRAKISAIAEEIKGRADAHDAKLNGDKKDEPESAESEESDPAESEPDMDTDDDGTLKAVRTPYKPILKACRHPRYSLADVQKAEREQKAPTTPAGDSPEDTAALERELRLLRRDKLRYG